MSTSTERERAMAAERQRRAYDRRRITFQMALAAPEPPIAAVELVACDRRAMRVTTAGCARAFLSAAAPGANVKPWEGRAACVGCALGAMRAGVKVPVPSAPAGASWCYRHDGPAERIIHGRICISCYNREREALGCSASPKTKRKPQIQQLAQRLRPVDVVVVADGETRTRRTPPVADVREALLQAAARTVAGALGRPHAVWPEEVAA